MLFCLLFVPWLLALPRGQWPVTIWIGSSAEPLEDSDIQSWGARFHSNPIKTPRSRIVSPNWFRRLSPHTWRWLCMTAQRIWHDQCKTKTLMLVGAHLPNGCVNWELVNSFFSSDISVLVCFQSKWRCLKGSLQAWPSSSWSSLCASLWKCEIRYLVSEV